MSYHNAVPLPQVLPPMLSSCIGFRLLIHVYSSYAK